MRKTNRDSNSQKGKENPSSRQTGAPGLRKYSYNPRNLPGENAGTSYVDMSNAKINGFERRSNEMPWDGAD